MYNLDKKQKIVLGIITAIVAGFICYYVYAQDNQSSITEEENLEVQEEEKEENYSDTRILVHVSGAVNQEGIVELKVNARIADAIEMAGGVREDAYVEEVNLAYKLEDGMKIHIPTKEEVEKQKEEKTLVEGEKKRQEEITMASGIEKIEEKKEEEKKVNLNTATKAQLENLPGIGTSTAQKIMDYRKEKGKFKTIEEIKEVNGIGESKFEKIKDLIEI